MSDDPIVINDDAVVRDLDALAAERDALRKEVADLKSHIEWRDHGRKGLHARLNGLYEQIDALRAYAERSERQIQALLNEIADMSGIERKTISIKKLRESAGVAEIMDAER